MVSNRSAVAGQRRGAPRSHTSRARWGSALDALAVSGFVALFLAEALDWFTAVGLASGLWLALIALPVGATLADLVSGLVHWFGDTFFSEDTPVLGAHWICPFRDHHRDPEAITGHGALELSGNTCWLLLTAMAISRVFVPATEGAVAAAGEAIFLATCLVTALSNHVHRWAHAPSVAAPIRRLQDLGLLLPPAKHARHHVGRHDRAYCVTTGWCNPALDRSLLLPWLERRLARRREMTPDARASGR